MYSRGKKALQAKPPQKQFVIFGMPHQHHSHDGHDHSHAHALPSGNAGRAFVLGIALNSIYVIAEFTTGYLQSSLSLMSDAGHNATDVLSLLLSLFGFRMMKVLPNASYTYGYRKVSILVSLINAIMLVVIVGFIIVEGIHRLSHPVAVPGITVSIIAAAGVAVNGISAWLFMKDRHSDINVKGAYLHLLADALVSAAVVLGGVLIWLTNAQWIDTALSFIVALVILRSGWGLLKDSLRLTLDGIPVNIDAKKIRELILKFPEVKGVHHLHIWALSSNQNALTAHIVLDISNLSQFDRIKKEIKHELVHANIHHATLEPEISTCSELTCERHSS
jgi:cobalt-zinc-cadmium efflux system protein